MEWQKCWQSVPRNTGERMHYQCNREPLSLGLCVKICVRSFMLLNLGRSAGTASVHISYRNMRLCLGVGCRSGETKIGFNLRFYGATSEL